MNRVVSCITRVEIIFELELSFFRHYAISLKAQYSVCSKIVDTVGSKCFILKITLKINF